MGGLAAEKARVQVQIRGEEYTFRTTADPDYLSGLALYVSEKMDELQKSNSAISKERLGVLAALSIADELFRLREQYERLTKLLEKEWEKRARDRGRHDQHDRQ